MKVIRDELYGVEPLVPDLSLNHAPCCGNSGNNGNNPEIAEVSRPHPARKKVGSGGNQLPNGYTLDARGLWFTDLVGDAPPVWICSPLYVSALTRNERSEAWGRLLEFDDPDGRHHAWACPTELLAGDGVEFRRQLLSMGLNVAPGAKPRNHLGIYVQSCSPKARVTCTGRTGWHREAYVLPDDTIGGQDGARVLLQTQADPPAMAQAGTPEDWREHVGAMCTGNSRLVFAASMAFAAPLLYLVGDGSGGVNLVGASSIGKTTALRIAASVWDSPDALRTWRATTNGLEGVASLHNDGLLVLDELGEVDPREAGAAAYMLANGAGKARARRDGLARPPAFWRVLFLSSGEIGLADHMSEAGKRARAGQEIRLADLPAYAGAEHGLFEDLHGYPDGALFAGALLDAARRSHGTLGRVFLERLVEIDRELLRKSIAEMRADFAADVLPTGADGQAKRVADRFALIAAGGALASRLGLTGWPDGEALKAAKTCYIAWLEHRGGAGSAEEAEAVATVDHFIELHGASRFAPLHDYDEASQRTIINRAGYVRAVEGRKQYLFQPLTFRRDVCAGLDYRRVLDALRTRGRLVPGDGSHLTKKIRQIGRVYVIWGPEDEG